MKERMEGMYHADEETRLLGSSSHTGITNDTNSETCSKTRETNGQTGTELDEALEQGHLQSDCDPSLALRSGIQRMQGTHGYRR